MPEWQQVRERKISAGDVRQDFIHSHGVALHAIAKVGNDLIKQSPKKWKGYLPKLTSIDWTRSNSKIWEGRAISVGRVSKANQSVLLTGNIIKRHLGLKLKPEEQAVEDAFLGGNNG